MYENKYEIEETSVDFQTSFDFPESEVVIKEEKKEGYNVKEMICVNDDVPIEYKKDAVNFWNPVDGGRKKLLETVKHRFRKVTPLWQLRRWQEQVNRGSSRLEKLRKHFHHIYYRKFKKVFK